MGNTHKIKGLSSTEAAERLHCSGYNEVGTQKRHGAFHIFLEKLLSPLFILMIGISAVSFAVGQKESAVIVLCMIMLSAVLDFVNTAKTQKTVDKLQAKAATRVQALRDGQRIEILAREVVPGDIIYLAAGNIVPADSLILESDDFFVNQSALTGESLPVEKIAAIDKQEKPRLDSPHFAFMGTNAVSGFATLEVVRTAGDTEFGKVAQALAREDGKTSFEQDISRFSLFIMKLVFYMVSFVFIIYLVRNLGHIDHSLILEAFTFALAITIGVTPDMLPAIMTICLARGSQMMAQKKVLVKKLSSIEDFGSMDILCTDKTGTLTQDHITLVRYEDYLGNESPIVLEYGHLSSHFHGGARNPLDTAVNDYKDIDVSAWRKIDEIPYDFERKRSSMVVSSQGKRLLITKGAPEAMMGICSTMYGETQSGSVDLLQGRIMERFRVLSKDGFRVLALAYRELADDATSKYACADEKDMIFAGFLAFLDPPKEGVVTTIKSLHELGVRIMILTGDNELLAERICRDIGVEVRGTLTGAEMAEIDDVQLASKLETTDIFARVTPLEKERIITALRKSGKTVAYLGDGINDAPALKAADVGISVDNAVDIAKDTADIILLEKSLEVLRDGIIEGRKTFHNTMKYVLMGLSSNFGNMFSMMGAVTFLPFLPMSPAQVLLNNFIYDASQFALPSDKVDEESLKRPVHWNMRFIRSYLLVFGLVSSVFDFLTFYLLYAVFRLSEHAFQTGWFIESMATQLLVVHIIRTRRVPFLGSRPSPALLYATFGAALIAWLIPFSPLGPYLGFVRLPGWLMLMIATYVVVYLGLVEAVKRWFYRINK